MSILNYRVKLAGGEEALFSAFDDAIAYACRIRSVGFGVAAIINDNRTDGSKLQGLTEDEYALALEVCQ